MVRDNWENVVAAMTYRDLIGIPCLAHILQLVIKDGWPIAFSQCNKSCDCLWVDWGPLETFVKSYKDIEGGRRDCVCQSTNWFKKNSTRWTSTKYMFDRLLEQRKAIYFALKELNMPMDLTTSNCDLMANILKIK